MCFAYSLGFILYVLLLGSQRSEQPKNVNFNQLSNFLLYNLQLPHITSNFLKVAMVIMVAKVMVVMLVMVVVDGTGRDGQNWHLNLTFKVTWDWQLSQFLQCPNHPWAIRFFLLRFWGSYTSKNVCVALKTTFLAKRDKKNHNFSFKKISKILDIDDSIPETFWYCENVRDLGFREYRRSIFSGLDLGKDA